MKRMSRCRILRDELVSKKECWVAKKNNEEVWESWLRSQV